TEGALDSHALSSAPETPGVERGIIADPYIVARGVFTKKLVHDGTRCGKKCAEIVYRILVCGVADGELVKKELGLGCLAIDCQGGAICAGRGNIFELTSYSEKSPRSCSKR